MQMEYEYFSNNWDEKTWGLNLSLWYSASGRPERTALLLVHCVCHPLWGWASAEHHGEEGTQWEIVFFFWTAVLLFRGRLSSKMYCRWSYHICAFVSLSKNSRDPWWVSGGVHVTNKWFSPTEMTKVILCLDSLCVCGVGTNIVFILPSSRF